MNPDPPPHPDSAPPNPSAGRLRTLVIRFGVAGFLFFLIKGLLWLIVPALLLLFGVQC